MLRKPYLFDASFPSDSVAGVAKYKEFLSVDDILEPYKI